MESSNVEEHCNNGSEVTVAVMLPISTLSKNWNFVSSTLSRSNVNIIAYCFGFSFHLSGLSVIRSGIDSKFNLHIKQQYCYQDFHSSFSCRRRTWTWEDMAIRLSVQTIVILLFISAAIFSQGTSASSKLNIPKVLLPLARSTKINFTLEATEGCYRWWVRLLYV